MTGLLCCSAVFGDLLDGPCSIPRLLLLLTPPRKESGSPLGLEPDDFSKCLDIVAGVTLYGHEFLLKLNEEMEHFTAFTSWLRHALEQITSTSVADDKSEDPQIDTLKVSQFIGTYLKESSLASFFSRDAGRPLKDYSAKGEKISEIYGDTENTAVPGFMELSDFLGEWCKAVFAKPQQAMRQQLRIGHPIMLNHTALSVSDMFMIEEYDHSVAYTILYADDPDHSNCTLSYIFLYNNLP